jgi:multiple sugar transport system substrate-binding protein
MITPSMEMYFLNFIGQAGGDLMDEKCLKCIVDSPEAIEGLQFMVDLVHKYGVSPGIGGMAERMTAVQLFETGRVAMAYDGSWKMNRYNERAEVNYDVQTLPYYRRRWISANGQANGMNARSKVKEAAWRWMKFYAGAEGQRILGEWKRGIPVMKKTANSPAFLNENLPPENERVFLDQMQWAHDLYPGLAFPQRIEIMGREVELALRGDKPVSDALSDLARELNKAIAEVVEEQ